MQRNGAICLAKTAVSRPQPQPYVNHYSTRFNWRLRAPSRVKIDKEKDGENSSYQKRLHPVVIGADVAKPFFNAVQQYSEKYVSFRILDHFFLSLCIRFLKLIALEEAQDEALLQHRLATWSVARLEAEGYCLTGMSAYWMQANQFGRPVATFLLGPGIILPENKLE